MFEASIPKETAVYTDINKKKTVLPSDHLMSQTEKLPEVAYRKLLSTSKDSWTESSSNSYYVWWNTS